MWKIGGNFILFMKPNGNLFVLFIERVVLSGLKRRKEEVK